MPTESPEDLLNTSDAAKLLDLSSDHVRRMSNAGKIPAIRTVAGHRLFRRGDLDKLIAERKKNPPTAGRPRKNAPTKKAVKKTKGKE